MEDQLLYAGLTNFGWTQNILFAANAYQQKDPIKNTLIGLHPDINAENLLFVAVNSGMFGFQINNTITNDAYITEKLNLDINSVSSERLANLINNVKLTLYQMIKDPQEFDFSNIKKMEE